MRLATVLAVNLAFATVVPAALHAQTLSLAGLNGQQVSISADALKAMPHVTATVMNAHTNTNETFSGVPLIDLLTKVGAPTGHDVRGKVLSEYVVATGSDNYRSVIALAEAEPDFHPGRVLVADQIDGKPIDPKQGPFRLVVTEDQRPARSVRNLVKLEIKQAE